MIAVDDPSTIAQVLIARNRIGVSIGEGAAAITLAPTDIANADTDATAFRPPSRWAVFSFRGVTMAGKTAAGRKNKRGPRTQPPLADAINARQLRFVEHFLESGNGTQAAIAAGYAPGSAKVTASDLLNPAAHPLVVAEIARRQTALNEKLEIRQERVLGETAAIAFSDITAIFADGPEGVPIILPMSEWSEQARKAIKMVKVKRYVPKRGEAGEAYEILEIGLWDKPAALERLWKRLELEGPGKGSDLEALSDGERIEKIAEILSRGRARRAGTAP